MSRSRFFSIYLLKPGFNETNALDDAHDLDEVEASSLPEKSVMLVQDSPPRRPWWRDYFGVLEDLSQTSKGALVFIKTKDRCFVLSFGHAYHNIKSECLEQDFGLRVTLNCADPEKVKSADLLEPGQARRRRTQLPVGSNLSYFDFEPDSNVLRKLTGLVKDEYKHKFKTATGSSSLCINCKLKSSELIDLCDNLLGIYNKEDFKVVFRDFLSVVPVKDVTTLGILDARLIDALRSRSLAADLTVPDIINYSDNVHASFSGCGQSKIYDDVIINNYYEYIELKGSLADLAIDSLRRHNLVLVDEDGRSIKDRWSIYKSLIFDLTIPETQKNYHFCDGSWYEISPDFVERVQSIVDMAYSELNLPAYNHSSEGEYNISLASTNGRYLTLDRGNISPSGQKAVEPCDVFQLVNEIPYLYHVKISTLSTELSHLFNQGVNSVELLLGEEESRSKFLQLLKPLYDDDEISNVLERIRQRKFSIVFAIVSRKDKNLKSINLPLFSRISLMRSLKALKILGVDAKFGFVKDETADRQGRQKKRRAARNVELEAA